MTQRQFNRMRKWDLRTRGAYDAGVIEGMDAYYLGYPRPEDPDEGHDAPFDLSFRVWPNDRLEQYYRNNQLARQRGAVDGWDTAKEIVDKHEEEDTILAEVEQGIADFENLLRRAA